MIGLDVENKTKPTSFIARIKGLFIPIHLEYTLGVWLILLLNINAKGQSVREFYQLFSTNEGLSSNSCNALLEDSKGFIWIGTSEGLNRFDGHQVKQFFHNPADTSSLCGNTIKCLAEAPDGKIWIGTYGSGIGVFDPVKETFEHYQLYSEHFLTTASNRINQLYINPDGSVISTTEGGMFLYIPSRNEFILLSLPQAEQKWSGTHVHLSSNSLRQGLWFNQSGHLWYYDSKTGKLFSKYNNPENWAVFSREWLTQYAMGDDQTIYLVDESSKQICSFNPQTRQLQEWGIAYQVGGKLPNRMLFSSEHQALLLSYWDEPSCFISLSNRSRFSEPFTLDYPGCIGNVRVNSLIKDSNGIEWIATSNGLFARNAKTQSHELHWFTNRPDDWVIKALLVDKEACWLLASDGIYRSDLKTEVRQKLSLPAINEKSLSCLYAVPGTSYLLVGHSEGLLQIDRSSLQVSRFREYSDSSAFSFKRDILQFVHTDVKGRLWVGTWKGNLTGFESRTGKVFFHASYKTTSILWPKSGLLCFHESPQGIYIGFNGGDGVWKWDESTQKFSPFLTPQRFPRFDGVVDALYADATNIYIGTHGGGMCIWNNTAQTMTYLSRYNGLIGDYVYRILDIGNGNLLFTTNNGIGTLRKSDCFLKAFNQDFKQDVPLFSNSGYIGPDGRIWFYSKTFFFGTKPQEWRQTVQKPVFTSIKLLDKEIGIPSNAELSLNYKQNFITIEFSSFPFLYKERIEYASKLVGVNDDWIISHSKNYADYTDLKGGEYDFQLKARVDGSDWSEVSHLRIRISPPYWETWWFRMLVILAIVGIVYSIYRYRLNQLEKLQLVRNTISSDLHDDVGASLSSINIYSKVAMERLQASPETVTELLNQINKNASETMDRMSDIVWSINPNNDTLQSLFNRIKLHCIEILQASEMEVHYKNELSSDMRIGMNARKNIFLISKEIVNNAAKYSEASELNISVKLNNDTLILLFSDNGKGIQHVNTKGGNGFRNMRNRVEELHGKITIESENGGGIHISILLPVARIREA